MKFLDQLFDHLIGPDPMWSDHQQQYPWINRPTFIDSNKLFTKREERSQYLLVDGTVVKIIILAKKNEYTGRGSITCKITEKDGIPVSAETIETTKTVLEVQEGQDIQVEDQRMLLVGLLD